MWQATHLLLTPFSGNRDYTLPLAASMPNLVVDLPHSQRTAATAPSVSLQPAPPGWLFSRCLLPSLWHGVCYFQNHKADSCLWGVSALCSERLSPQNRASSLMEEVRSVLLTVLTRWQNLWSTAIERWSYLQSIHIIRPLGARCYFLWICFPFFIPFCWPAFLAPLSDPHGTTITLDVSTLGELNGTLPPKDWWACSLGCVCTVVTRESCVGQVLGSRFV